MKYPKFLKDNSTIGITAPSSGVGWQIDDYEKSIENLKKNNWNIVETSNVRIKADVSSPAKQRGEEFNDLISNDNIDMVMCATGGDFLTDMLPYIDSEELIQNPKWVMGASDPTNLLYFITTAHDIAPIYGHNAGSFDAKELYKSQEVAIEFLKGNILPQESYPFYENIREGRIDGAYNLTEKSVWKSLNGDFDITGRLIGGCIDCLQYLPGTKYDYTKRFINKYKKDGFIWYFDVFALRSADFYLALFQLKESGWFEYVKGVIVGRVLFPNEDTSMTYEKALREIFGDIPIIMDADIGHVAPKMTIINGSLGHVTFKNNKGIIEQILK